MDDTLTAALRDLITTNHILHYHRVVDAFGHVSIRHPTEPSVYIMCGYMAPALVTSPSDLIHYHVSDSTPVNPNSSKGYSERFIHGEIFRKYPGVNCVIHSHAEEVLPYVISDVKLKAVYHMGGFLGSEGLRVFNIDTLYCNGDRRDMLVNNARFGTALAEKFARDPESDKPDETVVLMRRHGFTCIGRDIVAAVNRAVYTRINAEAQTKAMLLAQSGSKQDSATDVVAFAGLTAEHIVGCSAMNEDSQDKPWRLWVRETQSVPLYKNTLLPKSPS
jgi:ribulose-5-phosphate 4-epimerase/fuculose-1-phosphate aldolase